jgi:bifunctional DNase/RNase
MADLTLHAVQWCAHHGHPVLALRTSDDRFFVVAVSAEDAGSLAASPATSGGENRSCRLHGLVEATVAALGAHLTEIRLHVGSDAMLRAAICLRGPTGEVALPAHFADGVAFAHRGHLPIRMADEDLRRVPLAPLDTPRSAESGALPTAFRTLIESLNLDELDRNRDGDSSLPPRQAQ